MAYYFRGRLRCFPLERSDVGDKIEFLVKGSIHTRLVILARYRNSQRGPIMNIN